MLHRFAILLAGCAPASPVLPEIAAEPAAVLDASSPEARVLFVAGPDDPRGGLPDAMPMICPHLGGTCDHRTAVEWCASPTSLYRCGERDVWVVVATDECVGSHCP